MLEVVFNDRGSVEVVVAETVSFAVMVTVDEFTSVSITVVLEYATDGVDVEFVLYSIFAVVVVLIYDIEVLNSTVKLDVDSSITSDFANWLKTVKHNIVIRNTKINEKSTFMNKQYNFFLRTVKRSHDD